MRIWWFLLAIGICTGNISSQDSQGTLASLGTPVTTVCLEEMDETERRVTKGMQVLT